MAFIPAPDTIEVVLQQDLAGQDVFNVLNFLSPVPPGIPELHILITSVINAWIEFLAPLYVPALTLYGVKATDLSSATAPSILEPQSPPQAGTASGAAVSNNAALVLSQGTDARGRSFRGRTYAGGMPTTARANSAEMTLGYTGDFVDAWTAFFTDVEDNADMDHVVVSRYTGGVARTTAVMTVVTSYGANAQIDSMRSRLAGRGS